MSTRIANPFPIFLDKQGDPLTGGKVYIGTSGDDPQTSPIQVYIDEALTTPIPQPILVIGGLLTYDGNPVLIYTAETGYSIRARDIDGAQVFYTAVAIPGVTDFQPLDADLTAIAALATTAFGRDLLTQANGAAVQSYIGIVAENPLESLILAVTDETTAIAAGANKLTFRMPYGFALTEVRASLTTAQTSGSIFTVDINEGGASILSTKLTIDNGEKTSTTAAGAPLLVDVTLANDAEITIDIDQIGDGTAKGLKVTLIGRRA